MEVEVISSLPLTKKIIAMKIEIIIALIGATTTLLSVILTRLFTLRYSKVKIRQTEIFNIKEEMELYRKMLNDTKEYLAETTEKLKEANKKIEELSQEIDKLKLINLKLEGDIKNLRMLLKRYENKQQW